MILVILVFLLHIIVGLIPGFRVLTFFVPSSFCNPGIDIVGEIYSFLYNDVIIYYETELALGLCLFLYIWCTISIFYQVKTNILCYPMSKLPFFHQNSHKFVIFHQKPSYLCILSLKTSAFD